MLFVSLTRKASAAIAGADNFMAEPVYHFYKLYRLTGDPHWLDFALFLQDSTMVRTAGQHHARFAVRTRFGCKCLKYRWHR